MADIVQHIVLPSANKCDFCSKPEPTHCFVADDIHLVIAGEFDEKLKQVILSSDPHWGACDECAVLVKARDREKLYQRCFAEFKKLEGQGETPLGMVALRIIQDTMFWSAFTGKEHSAAAHREPVQI